MLSARPTHVLAWLACALILAGCGDSPAGQVARPTPTPPGKTANSPTGVRELRVGDERRRLVLDIPAHEKETRVGLILAFHGRGDTPRGMRELTALHRAAAREGLAVAYLEARDRRWDDGRTTRDGRDPQADIEFADRVVTELVVERLVDPERVYAVGVSDGGGFVLRLAAERPQLVRGVVSVAGQLATTVTVTGKPPPALMVYGRSDPLRPYRGLPESRIPDRPDAPTATRGARASAALWAQAAGARRRSRRSPLNRIAGDGTSVERVRWSARGRTAVELWSIDGGGHTWPGSEAGPGPNAAGPVSAEFDASREAVRFLLGLAAS